MAEVTAALIKEVRAKTGMGMSDVKAALVEADGDADAAVEALRLKGAKDVNKREGRTAANGAVVERRDGDVVALLELNCETDFVAKGDDFQQLAGRLADLALRERAEDVDALLAADLDGVPASQALGDASASLGEKLVLRRVAVLDGGHVDTYLHRKDPDLPPSTGTAVVLTGDAGPVGRQVAQHVAAFPVRYLRREDVPDDVVASERRIAEESAREEGKPEQALPKIVEGRLTGFYKEVVLLDQGFVKEPKKSVAKVLEEAGVELTRFERFRVGAE